MRSTGYNPSLTYDDFVFLTTTKVVLQGMSMPIVGQLCRIIGCRWSIFLGSAIYSVGFMLTAVTIKYWFSLAILSLAAHGLAFSFIYATAIGAAQAWFPKNKRGFVGSFVLSGYGFGKNLSFNLSSRGDSDGQLFSGSLIWIPLQTAFVNPGNIPAVADESCDRNTTNCNLYYTDPGMLERIPIMFLMLGAIYAILGLVSVLMIREPRETQSENTSLQEAAAPEEDFNLRPTEVLRTLTFYQVKVVMVLLSKLQLC